jgi:SOS-response transcriptional repressor LexA
MQEYQRQHGYPPTLSEIGDAIGLTKSPVCGILNELENTGAIVRLRYYPRGSYIPTEPNQFQSVAWVKEPL